MTISESDLDPTMFYAPVKAGEKRPITGSHAKDSGATRPEIRRVNRWVANGGNLAVVTGPRSSCWVLDVDVKNGAQGAETLAALEAEHGELPRTRRVDTPTGGWHLYFRLPEGIDPLEFGSSNGKALGPGLDVKGHGGFVLAPGSETEDGPYELTDSAKIAATPEWLATRLIEFFHMRTSSAERRSQGLEQVPKATTFDKCCAAVARGAVAELRAVATDLVALKEGERLEALGQSLGWDQGAFVLAGRLAEIAQWPNTRYNIDRARNDFVTWLGALDGSVQLWRKWEEGGGSTGEWVTGALHRSEVHDEVRNPVTTLGKSPKAADRSRSRSERDEVYSVAHNVDPGAFASELVEREFTNDVLRLRYSEDEQTWWLWESFYRHIGQDSLKAILRKRLDGCSERTPDGEKRPVVLKKTGLSELVDALTSRCLIGRHGAGELLPTSGGVPFRNGWLDVESGSFGSLSPERDVRWVVPVDYSADAGCPEWLAFLDSLGWGEGTEEARLLAQWFGYLLSGSKRHEKALLMVGPKRAGKGTILRVAEALLGDGSTSLTLDSLLSNFGLQDCIGKGLATIGDARFGRSDKGLNERLLSLTSNDRLPIDVKYHAPLSVNLGVRLMLGSNETPSFIEASDALAHRFMVLQLTRDFSDSPDVGLYARLRGELAGIARWALEGLRDLTDEGAFSETQRGLEIREEIAMDSSQVRRFTDESCVLGADRSVVSDELYREYVRWAQDANLFVLSKPKFFADLNAAFPGQIKNLKRRIGDKRVPYKQGIAVTDEYGPGGPGGGPGESDAY